jgi:FtsZ-binding cell division protein ZapB
MLAVEKERLAEQLTSQRAAAEQYQRAAEDARRELEAATKQLEHTAAELKQERAHRADVEHKVNLFDGLRARVDELERENSSYAMVVNNLNSMVDRLFAEKETHEQLHKEWEAALQSVLGDYERLLTERTTAVLSSTTQYLVERLRGVMGVTKSTEAQESPAQESIESPAPDSVPAAVPESTESTEPAPESTESPEAAAPETQEASNDMEPGEVPEEEVQIVEEVTEEVIEEVIEESPEDAPEQLVLCQSTPRVPSTAVGHDEVSLDLESGETTPEDETTILARLHSALGSRKRARSHEKSHERSHERSHKPHHVKHVKK